MVEASHIALTFEYNGKTGSLLITLGYLVLQRVIKQKTKAPIKCVACLELSGSSSVNATAS